MWAIGEPSGPIENGTTYIVRPRMEPLKRSVEDLAHLGRVAPVVGRAGVLLALRADEGPVLDPGDVVGVGEGQVGVRPLGVGEPLEGAAVDQLLAERVVLLGGAVAPVDRRRARSARRSRSTQAISFCVLVVSACGGLAVVSLKGSGSTPLRRFRKRQTPGQSDPRTWRPLFRTPATDARRQLHSEHALRAHPPDLPRSRPARHDRVPAA